MRKKFKNIKYKSKNQRPSNRLQKNTSLDQHRAPVKYQTNAPLPLRLSRKEISPVAAELGYRSLVAQPKRIRPENDRTSQGSGEAVSGRVGIALDDSIILGSAGGGLSPRSEE